MSTLSHQRNRIYRATDWTLYRQQRAYLAELFPAIAAAGQPKRPLALGVRYSLIGANTGLSEAEIKHFLRAYTFGPKYLRTLKSGAWRYDLDGARNGWVSPNEAEHAALSLRTHYATRERRRLVGNAGLRAVAVALQQQAAEELPTYEEALLDAEKARALFNASKGGNVRGITENHRYELALVAREAA